MNVSNIRSLLRRATKDFLPPLIDQIITEFWHDPYLILIACLLSLRAKDRVTIHVCRDLFSKITTPDLMVVVPQKELEKILFIIGFYKIKARVLKNISRDLIDRFAGKVPHTYAELITLKGVGPKTANLVLGQAFGIPAICVDIHVHRISNRLGLIKTKTVEESEFALSKILEKKHWIEWNNLLVIWGQNICLPVRPQCSNCVLHALCKKVGVLKNR